MSLIDKSFLPPIVGEKKDSLRDVKQGKETKNNRFPCFRKQNKRSDSNGLFVKKRVFSRFSSVFQETSQVKIDKSNLSYPTTNDVIDIDFMDWQHKNKCCCVCGAVPIEVHHIHGRMRGRNDRETVPLCWKHHRGEFSPHGRDVKEFYNEISKDELLAVARINYKEFLSDT